MPFRFRRSLRLGAALMASAIAGCMAASNGLIPNPVTVATGTPGGVYHPVGNVICRMFNREDEQQTMPCIALSSDGSVANIRNSPSSLALIPAVATSRISVANGSASVQAALDIQIYPPAISGTTRS